ncbi:ABC transporter [Nocardiopsis terrae]|uniref:ABC-2 type transport system ATP-binding protein n=1 Tax=Nocardiopsis terrae TaxID=372655 RepID=A0ABR9HL55_9ACTN|nr:ABC transporter ATP-binding protein [Nocardiopsis terrae]MBE1459737.1 ABC-2 type transport system ATP-binding protein [Nocardiopsis terrae]GHC94221.1 ABC transporter [Nocardiopsis terrae]
MSETVIEAEGLKKKYGDTEAVAGIDLSIARGEIFSFLGPNGAGKSTTVEILEGFRNRDGGSARVLGEDPGRAGREWRSRVGIVWQQETMVPKLAVRDVVRHFAGYYPLPHDPDAVIELVGLGHKAEDLAESLSGGQRRRLDVALGIVGQPELLFLDEPTTGFDPRARREFWGLIRDLAARGTTIVLTTHYLEEAEELADRVCVIARGRVRAVDTPAALGGRASAQATVGWLEDGERREVLTDEPTRVVSELAGRFTGEVPELSVHRPTLEEIYLGMVKDTDEAEEAAA